MCSLFQACIARSQSCAASFNWGTQPFRCSTCLHRGPTARHPLFFLFPVYVACSPCSCGLALLAQFYPKKYPANFWLLLGCVVAYVVLSTLMTGQRSGERRALPAWHARGCLEQRLAVMRGAKAAGCRVGVLSRSKHGVGQGQKQRPGCLPPAAPWTPAPCSHRHGV